MLFNIFCSIFFKYLSINLGLTDLYPLQYTSLLVFPSVKFFVRFHPCKTFFPNLSTTTKNHLSHSFVSVSMLSPKEKIMFFHCRLGHASFGVIKVMFPSLFSGFNVNNFHCEVCKIAKHKCVPFPLSDTRSRSPFYLIHTDFLGSIYYSKCVWGSMVRNFY